MSIEQEKATIVGRIWQSIAQSGVSLSAIPKEQLETLVDAIAGGMLLAIDDALEEAGLTVRQAAVAGSAPLTTEEKVLWEGRPLLSLTTFYRITTERVRIYRGIIGKDVDDVELIRVQDIDRTQAVGERILGIGDIVLKSSDPSLPEVTLRNVRDPDHVHEILRRCMLDARRRFRYSVQEEM